MWGDLDDFAFEAAYGDGGDDANVADENVLAFFSDQVSLRGVTLEELSEHNTPEDCWVALHGRVYDLTAFAKGHVGGAASITILAGTDGTTAFARKHGANVLNSLSKDCWVGELSLTGDSTVEATTSAQEASIHSTANPEDALSRAYCGDVRQLLGDILSSESSDDASKSLPSPPSKRHRVAGSAFVGPTTTRAIVVGGGLAGVSAANTVVECGGRVVLLEKACFCGGNSTKATSGINGAGTEVQRAQGIQDSSEAFEADTLAGGAKSSALAKTLCENSADAISWLADNFKIDLSTVGQLGGHSKPRTHRGKERFPGMTITYSLIESLEKLAERSDLVEIVTKARVTRLLTDSHGSCTGCEYQREGAIFQELGSVIIATGGFGADFGKDSLLAQHRPDLLHLPTTNSEQSTGDGIKLGQAIGAQALDLEWVQVHPTGLVAPNEPDAKVKFLAAEALRGAGGLIVDGEGRRFVNELGRRDDTTREMWKSKPPFRLLLNNAAAQEVIWHCRHYKSRGLMQFYESGLDLASDIGIPLSTLEATHEEHWLAAEKTQADPENGPWSAYPGGQSWDRVSGVSGRGKRFFKNVIKGSQVRAEPFCVALITPVLHYCMGGLETDTTAAAVASSGKPIAGLWAVGEVAGGVHGNNRLGGNSLLDCVVFGRIAGRECVKQMLGDVRDRSLMDVLDMPAESPKLVVANAPIDCKVTLEEVRKHDSKSDCWIVVHGKVFDVTHFLNDHPGGALSILAYAGRDATAEFDMVHPPGAIDKYASGLVIAELKESVPVAKACVSAENLPRLAWCPCCREPLKIIAKCDTSGNAVDTMKNTSWAECNACDIKVSISRRQGITLDAAF